jgi:hypothetical protein
MDDFGNILYLIFIVISLLGGLWQNYNRQKANKDQTSTVPSFEEDFAETFEIRDIVAEQQQEKEAREKIDELEQKANLVRKNRRIKQRSDILIESESQELENDSAFDLKEFDAKKAVIYSEILNPPYL